MKQKLASPVLVFPSTATTLVVAPNWSTVLICDDSGTPFTVPSWFWQLQDDDGKTLTQGTVNATLAQWNSWTSGSGDYAYILSCVATNLGLTLTGDIS